MTKAAPDKASTNFKLLLIIVSDLIRQQVAGFVVLMLSVLWRDTKQSSQQTAGHCP